MTRISLMIGAMLVLVLIRTAVIRRDAASPSALGSLRATLAAWISMPAPR